MTSIANGESGLSVRTKLNAALADVIIPVLNDTTQSAANATLIQAALNLGGTVNLTGNGVCYLNAPMVIGSRTRLVVDENLTLRNAPGSATSLIRSSAYNRCLNNGWTNVTIGQYANGLATFTANPVNGDTLTLNGTAITFVNSGATGNQVNISAGNPGATMNSLLAFLQASSDTQLVKFTYALVGITTTLGLFAASPGAAGAALTLATTSASITLSAPTLIVGLDLTVAWTGHGLAVEQSVVLQPQLTLSATVLGATNALTSTSSPTLHFASTPAGVVAGNSAYDNTTGKLLGTVSSTTATTVVLTANSAFAVASGDTVSFGATYIPSINSAYYGTFRITTVLDANRFMVALYRVPASDASGTVQALVADQDIYIEGGVWDWNAQNNVIDYNTPNGHIGVMMGVDGLHIKNIKGQNAVRTFTVGAVSYFTIEDVTSVRAGSILSGDDVVKVYGPAFTGTVDNVRGFMQDDCVSLQPLDNNSQFIAENITHGGDVINVTVSRVAPWFNDNGGGFVTVYPCDNYTIDNITIEKCVGMSRPTAQSPFRITSGSVAAFVGKITYRDILWPSHTGSSGLGAFTINTPATIQHLVFDSFTMGVPPASYSATTINIGSNVNFLEVANSKFQVNNGNVALSFYGGIFPEINVFNCGVIGANGSNVGAFIGVPTSTNVGTLILDNCNFSSIFIGVQLGAGNNSSNTHVTLHGCSGSVQCGVRAYSSAIVRLEGNRFYDTLYGTVRAESGAALSIYSNGNTIEGSSPAWLTISGGTVAVYGMDFHVDVSTLLTTNGQMAYSTGVLGTGLAICPASGIWKLL